MSELSESFVYPVDRSVATAGSKMLDRISVRDYIVDVEIGAFKVEQGIKQKIIIFREDLFLEHLQLRQ